MWLFSWQREIMAFPYMLIAGTIALTVQSGLTLSKTQMISCPPGRDSKIHDAFGLSDQAASVQLGVFHRLPCTAYPASETPHSVAWYKGRNLTDPDKLLLLNHTNGVDLNVRDRYEISSRFSLVIKRVKATDAGRYLCHVLVHESLDRVEPIDIRVIDDSFPASSSVPSPAASFPAASFQRGRRETLPCPCAPQILHAPISTVYWSTGEGVTGHTTIIAARFSEHDILEFQSNADYSIRRDASLRINSLHDLDNKTRFWCHVFQSDGMQKNCFVNVTVKNVHPVNEYALRVSPTFFYLQKGVRQILPCTSWKPEEKPCNIRWFKVDTVGRHILSYTVAGDDVEADAGVDLAGDFGLAIESVNETNAGRYICSTGPGNTFEAITAEVIGNTFPLDDIVMPANHTVTDLSNSLPCPAISNSETIRATVIWSVCEHGICTVIGKLYLPEGSKTMSVPGDDCCFDITSNGSLLRTNRSQHEDTRYWCHVFHHNGTFGKSFVDVKSPNLQSSKAAHLKSSAARQRPPFNVERPSSGVDWSPTLIPVVACVVFVLITVATVCVLVMYRRTRSAQKREENEGML